MAVTCYLGGKIARALVRPRQCSLTWSTMNDLVPPDSPDELSATLRTEEPDPLGPHPAVGPVLIAAAEGSIIEAWRPDLNRRGVGIVIALGLEEGLARARESGVASIVVDAGHEGGSGIEFIRALRNEGNPATILVATKAGDSETVIQSLESGADGCFDRTSSGRELVARLQALVRRRQPGPRPSSVSWTMADLRVDPATRSVFRNDEQIVLGPREFAVLLALLRRRGRIVSQQEVLHDVWRRPPRPTAHSVETVIRDLRRKLETAPRDRGYIVTVRSGGYMIPRDG
jgi:DNA-binding response OmpR family regulator